MYTISVLVTKTIDRIVYTKILDSRRDVYWRAEFNGHILFEMPNSMFSSMEDFIFYVRREIV